ncbi:hypothetical protein J3E68DRAFT_432204 [Trichoderma sp. SZMC 28012]
MPKRFPPTLLESPEAGLFCLQKQITDLSSLRHQLKDSVFLGIDVEGCEGIGEGITSIGLAILPPTSLQSTEFPSLPFETQEFVDRYKIESYCLYLEGRSRRRPFPPFPSGCTIKTADAGKEIRTIVDSIKQRYIGKDIILVGWHPHPRELPAIQVLFPSLFQEMVGWVDVVDIIQQVCISKQEDLAKTWPPLGDVMLSIGFSKNCKPQRYCHCAGSDAIHTIAVLVRLLTHDTNGPSLEVRRRRPLKQWRQRQK